MALAPLVKFHNFIDELSKAGHNLATDVFKLALTNTAPNQATDTVWSAAAHPPPAAANGYPSGGNTITTTSAITTAGMMKLILVDSVFTPTAGGIGPFRYTVLYNSSKANKVVGYADNGASVTINPPDTFTADFDATNGALTVQ